MSRVSVVRSSSNADGDPNVIKDEGRFTFANGDAYTGGFMLVKDKQFVTRQGHGLYLTEDFNEYEARWSEDRTVGEARICYNDGTRYRGTYGIDGEIFGSGAYTFTDNSVLRATWQRNKPATDITMKEELLAGSMWKGVSSGKEVTLTAANHFWNEIDPLPGDGSEEEEEEEKRMHLDVGSDH